jgi:hypothetical protein
MGRLSAFLVALALGAASAMALASCGGGSNANLLPGTTANQINSNLDQVQKLVNEGDCVGAEDGVAAVMTEVEDLQGVDRKLKAALEEGTTRLSEVVTECDETASEEAEPTLESDVEAEELEREEHEAEEKAEKAKEKPEKHGKEPSEEATETDEEEGGNLPPQSKGEGKAKGHETEPPPATEQPSEESPSGGVGPAVGVEEK